MDSDSATISALAQASAGLLYPSESDEPFDVIRWDEPGLTPFSASDVLALRVGKGRAIEEVAVESFFSAIASAMDPERLERLRRTLQKQLTGLQIFRVGTGEAEVDIYLLGRTTNGNWAGLHTKSVET